MKKDTDVKETADCFIENFIQIDNEKEFHPRILLWIQAFMTMSNKTIDDSNRSENHAPQLTQGALIRVYVLVFLGIISLSGNIMILIDIIKSRSKRRNSRQTWSAIYTLMLHLVIADLLVTVFCIFGEASWSYTVEWYVCKKSNLFQKKQILPSEISESCWYHFDITFRIFFIFLRIAGEFACKCMKLLQMFALYLSTYVLVLIGIDRWVAVKYPMKSLNKTKRCNRLLMLSYVLSMLMSLPQVSESSFHRNILCTVWSRILAHDQVCHDVW